MERQSSELEAVDTTPAPEAAEAAEVTEVGEVPEVWSLVTREDWTRLTAAYNSSLPLDRPAQGRGKRRAGGEKSSRELLIQSFSELREQALAGVGEESVDIALSVLQVHQDQIVGGSRAYWFTLRTSPLILSKLKDVVGKGTMVYDIDNGQIWFNERRNDREKKEDEAEFENQDKHHTTFELMTTLITTKNLCSEAEWKYYDQPLAATVIPIVFCF